MRIRHLKMALMAAMACGAAGTASAATPFYSYGFGSHTYDFYLDVGITWTDARANALSYGGYLANLTSAAESQAAGFIGQNGFTFWLGGAEAADNVYSWQDGPEAGLVFWNMATVPGVYSNFNTGEPNNSGGDQKFLRYNNGQSLTWDDFGPIDPQATMHGYLVEASVPEPAAWGLMIAGFGLTGSVLRRRRGALVKA